MIVDKTSVQVTISIPDFIVNKVAAVGNPVTNDGVYLYTRKAAVAIPGPPGRLARTAI